MVKITFTGKQYVLTVPKDIIELMGWDKETEVIISKYPNKDFLFIEEIRKREPQKEDEKNKQ